MPKTQRPQQGRQPSKERENLGKKKKNNTTIKPSNNNEKFDKSKLKVKKKKKKKKSLKKLRDIKQTTVHPHPIKMH